jgi:tetratricopeptide (TPR) repeat protein
MFTSNRPTTHQARRQSLGRRDRQTQNLKDLDDEIEIIKRCVNAGAQKYNPHLEDSKIAWMTMLAARYEQMPSDEDLRDAAQLDEEGIQRHQDGYIEARKLSMALSTQSQKTGQKVHLKQAIRFGEWGAPSNASKDPHLWTWLMVLSQMLRDLFDWEGDVDHIDRAISHINRSMSLAPQDQIEIRVSQLSDRAILLYRRYERTSNEGDLDEAIKVMKGLIRGNPKAYLCGNLSNFLESKYEATGRREYLDEAILRANDAIGLASLEEKPRYCHALAVGCLNCTNGGAEGSTWRRQAVSPGSSSKKLRRAIRISLLTRTPWA